MEFNKDELIHKHPSDIADRIAELNEDEQPLLFLLLPGEISGEVFPYLDRETQETILLSLGTQEVAKVLSSMSPDDRTRVFEEFPDRVIKEAVNFLSSEERKMALSLIGYHEDSIARIMTPYYIQARKEWTVRQALDHIKRNGKKVETLDYIYIVDEHLKLIDEIKINRLLMCEDFDRLESLMDYETLSLTSTLSKEEAIILFERYDRAALPIVSENGVLVGIVTFDDIAEQVEKRDTEDIQKFGGLEALDLPYKTTPLLEMVRKRAGWLIILFLSEMLTASAMGFFEQEIDRAVVLALFIPLIISSGGNSGSQAATLIIRAMALNEIVLKDWWKVMRKEVLSGLMLGSILGLIGFVRIVLWQQAGLYNYGEYSLYVGLTVSLSLVGIVLWGTLSGSMIPFILRYFGLDPATSSAPFVATLVDVTGLIIYFSIAAFILQGKLL